MTKFVILQMKTLFARLFASKIFDKPCLIHPHYKANAPSNAIANFTNLSAPFVCHFELCKSKSVAIHKK